MIIPIFFALILNLSFTDNPSIDKDKLMSDLKQLSSKEFEGRLTGTAGNLKAQKMIVERFKSLHLKSFSPTYLQSFDFTHYSIKGIFTTGRKFITDYHGSNVLGYISGKKDSTHFIVISAHYDHLGIKNGKIYLGADDNASGTAALLSYADYFSKNKPDHSIFFIAFDAEEEGLRGSKVFFKQLPVKKEQLLLDINLDMISRNDKNEIYAAGTSYYPFLKPVLEKAKKNPSVNLLFGHDSNSILDPGYDWTDGSDHGVFHDNGIPFVYFGVEDHEDYHKPTDTFEKINPEFYTHIVEMILGVSIQYDQKWESLK